jgi:possible type I restriction-modification system, S subunit
MKRYETYKDSGLHWVGKIPSHWDEEKLKYISTCNDEVLPEDTPESELIHYVEISDVDSVSGIRNHTDYTFGDAPSRARRITRKNDVIISTVRPCLKAIASVKENGLIVSTGFAVIRPTKVCQKFLAYSLLNDNFLGEVISKSVGVGYPAINSKDLIGIKLPMPPKEEQQAIASYLDYKVGQIDTTIAEKEQMLEDLKSYRSIIISESVTKGLDKTVEMKDSGIEWLGKIPKKWDCSSLKYYLSEPLQYGANESAESNNANWPRCIRITDIDEYGNLKDETFKSLSPEKAKDYILEKGDVLFARSGATVGKTYIFKESYKACFAGYLVKAKCGMRLLPEFLYLYTNTIQYENWKNSVFIQATIQNIGAHKYSLLSIIIPPIKEQQGIIEYVNTKVSIIEEALKELQAQMEDLKSYRSSLITDAVTGKIDLREWKPKEENV